MNNGIVVESKTYNLTRIWDTYQYMKLASSNYDWNQRAHAVRRANGGRLPVWFVPSIVRFQGPITSASWDKERN